MQGENYLKKIDCKIKNFLFLFLDHLNFTMKNMINQNTEMLMIKFLGIKFLVSKGYKAIRMGKYEQKK